MQVSLTKAYRLVLSAVRSPARLAFKSAVLEGVFGRTSSKAVPSILFLSSSHIWTSPLGWIMDWLWYYGCINRQLSYLAILFWLCAHLFVLRNTVFGKLSVAVLAFDPEAVREAQWEWISNWSPDGRNNTDVYLVTSSTTPVRPAISATFSSNNLPSATSGLIVMSWIRWVDGALLCGVW